MIEKYFVDHPTDMAVEISGDTAVLTFTAVNDAKKLIRSCDVFVYRGGHWRALYSQHTDAERGEQILLFYAVRTGSEAEGSYGEPYYAYT